MISMMQGQSRGKRVMIVFGRQQIKPCVGCTVFPDTFWLWTKFLTMPQFKQCKRTPHKSHISCKLLLYRVCPIHWNAFLGSCVLTTLSKEFCNKRCINWKPWYRASWTGKKLGVVSSWGWPHPPNWKSTTFTKTHVETLMKFSPFSKLL